MSEEKTDRSEADGGTLVWFLGAATLGALALVIAILALFLPNTDGGGGATGEVMTVEVKLGEMYIEPASIDVPAGTEVVFEVTNEGALPHDFVINGDTGTAMLDPGASETFEAGVIDASSDAWCTVPGHKEAGMVMAINVEGDSSGDHAADPAAAEGDFATIDQNAEPAEGWEPRDPALAPADSATVHEVTFRMTEKVMEVAPGVEQEMWTFEDQVPGPTLRGKVGDTFKVTIVNEGKLGHSIDFHASKVAWNDEMRTIEPGESLDYEFVATAAGAFMYHCGTAPTLHHIGNGMYGALIVDPPDLPAVDKEYFLVQSELYLGPDGKPGDLTKMQNDDWDAVVFNGFWNQYKFAPIRVETEERVRVWVIDDGPSENSAFHIVGTIFDTVWKEGAYLLRPDATQGGSQVLDLQPAQGGFVEFTFAEDGFYPIVTHKFSNVGKGALGLFQSGDVELPGGGGH